MIRIQASKLRSRCDCLEGSRPRDSSLPERGLYPADGLIYGLWQESAFAARGDARPPVGALYSKEARPGPTKSAKIQKRRVNRKVSAQAPPRLGLTPGVGI